MFHMMILEEEGFALFTQGDLAHCGGVDVRIPDYETFIKTMNVMLRNGLICIVNHSDMPETDNERDEDA